MMVGINIFKLFTYIINMLLYVNSITFKHVRVIQTASTVVLIVRTLYAPATTTLMIKTLMHVLLNKAAFLETVHWVVMARLIVSLRAWKHLKQIIPIALVRNIAHLDALVLSTNAKLKKKWLFWFFQHNSRLINQSFFYKTVI